MPLRLPVSRKKAPRWKDFKLDLSKRSDQVKVLIFLLVSLLAGAALLIGGYEGYHYTESSEFCGTACHVMEPQYIRYEDSSHENVACAKCHIGPGASFFVKSKIDGLRQVIAVLLDTYERPIPSPVHNLRPARDICEQCHSPSSYQDNIIKNAIHFNDDKDNTKISYNFILKMGGWQENMHISEGIHWHITAPLYYIAADEQRQLILWVGVEQEDGRLVEYYSRDMIAMAQTDFVEEAIAAGEMRQMDCIDCHNRTAHLIPEPASAIDQALSENRISRDLPYIRREAVAVLTPFYPSREEGYQAIESIMDFYQQNYPEVFENQQEDIRDAMSELIIIYENSQFPEMNLDWRSTPNNGRHTPDLGCFRCHDDKHIQVSPEGDEVGLISVRCNLCHTVPIIGVGDDLTIEAPVIAGPVPDSHSDFSFTVEHRSVTEAQIQEDCYQCHGQRFCNNGACHNLEHPEDMIFSHAEEFKAQGEQVCFTCHQDFISCSRCHTTDFTVNP